MKITRKQCIAVVVGITLGFATGAGAAKGRGRGGGALPPGQWTIMTYVPENGYTVPIPLPVQKIRGGGVSFDFLPTPDRAVLLTGVKPAKRPKDSLTGKTISAHIVIIASPGAAFNYCGDNCDGTDNGGFVRLYLQGTNPAAIGCESGWHPARPDCEAQYWWSNPVAIDLDVLAALGTTGTDLEVSVLDLGGWSDRDGHSASQAPSDVCWGDGADTSNPIAGCMYVDHAAALAAAVANATKMGLSFGGGGNFAFGAGVTDPATATFQLLKLQIK